MITFSQVPSNAAASGVFVEQEAVARQVSSPVLEHKLLIFGQYNSGKSPTDDVAQLILNKEDAWTRYGRGSLLAAMYEAAFAALGGIVPIYAMPLADDGSAVVATGTVVVTGTATETGTLAIYVGGKRIAVAVTSGDDATTVGDSIAAAINADLDLPVTAANVTGTVTFTVRWGGAAGNQIRLEVNLADTDATPAGITVVVTDIGVAVLGANDPDAAAAFAGLGDVWYTEIVYPYQGTTEILVMEASGTARADALVRRMFAGFIGYADTNANLLTALDSRNSEWTTYIPVHGSSTAAYVIGSAGAAVYAKTQQATAGRPSKGLVIPGVLAGLTNILTYGELDATVNAGGSTTRNLSDSRVVIVDLVTTRTETDLGADTTDWRFTVIIGNLQFKSNALEQTFLSPPFDQAVVLSDTDVGGPTFGIRPKTVKTYGIALVDDWIARGLSTERDTIVAGITSVINGSNPGRIDLLIPDTASAGLRIVAVKLEWAFVR